MYYLSHGIPKTNQRNSKNWLAESCNAELKLHCLNSDVRNSWVFIVQLWTTSDAGALMNICMSFEILNCNISYWNMIKYWWRESPNLWKHLISAFSFPLLSLQIHEHERNISSLRLHNWLLIYCEVFFPTFIITYTWAGEISVIWTASLIVNLLWNFLSYFCHYIYMNWRNFQ